MQINGNIKHPRVPENLQGMKGFPVVLTLNQTLNGPACHMTPTDCVRWQLWANTVCEDNKDVFFNSLEDAGRMAVEGGGGINKIRLKDYKNCGEYECFACHARWQDKDEKKKIHGPIPIFSKQCVADSEERICGPLEASEAYILRSHAFKQDLIYIYLTIYIHTYAHRARLVTSHASGLHPTCLYDPLHTSLEGNENICPDTANFPGFLLHG